VAYLMYTEVFSLDSKTAHFNRAVNQVKKDPRCLELLGDSKKIVAHGQGQVPKGWRHDRQITYVVLIISLGNQMLTFTTE